MQRRASIPYEYRVQITPTVTTDAGQLAVASTQRAMLGDAGVLPAIVVARAVTVRGSVRSADNAALEAELVFTPRDDNELGGARSAFTRPGADGPAFDVTLEPNRTYDVLVYPRGPDSFNYPPYTFELATATGEQVAPFQYGPLTSLSGTVRDENGEPAPRGARIKTRFRERLLASSSVGTIGDAGTFEVRLPQAVLDAPDGHELALDLSEVKVPQNVQIAFDMSKLPQRGEWVMPVVPDPVLFTGTVEIADLKNVPFNAVNAQLTFISKFPIPPGNMYQGNMDWCQLRRSPASKDTFRCSAYVPTNVDSELRIGIELLPGDYDIVIAPSGTAPTPQRLATAIDSIDIQTQSDAGLAQGPNAYSLNAVTQYEITVNSPGNRPMPSVVVSANALGVRADLPEVALYNRSDSRSTVHDGKARVAVDTGVYDLIAAPPEDSGYAWVLAFNRRVDFPPPKPGEVTWPTYTLLPQLPVILRGSAVTADGSPVAQANVDAYALVPDIERGPDRAVRIAHATTDREGKFALQMPPRIGSDDDVLNDAGVTDASADAQR
ncbi:MAG TPA: hypothetical protein VFX59_11820 [Polyangiales bacterium]|nr:hypothetical protein [Polyangiales bacterium]